MTKMAELDKLLGIWEEQQEGILRLRNATKKLLNPILSLRPRRNVYLVVKISGGDKLTFSSSYHSNVAIKARGHVNADLLLLENIDTVLASMKRRINRYGEYDDRKAVISTIIDTLEDVSNSIDTVCRDEDIDMEDLIEEVR